jgi:alkanesulfonate monooxygenase SsuD/methylene tetrahydromethanopterin reductase-like flavin-dependent oxidoreductase (luciferase family)
VLGFSVGSIDDLEQIINSYKGEIPNAEPVGAFVNDNIMVATAGYIAEDERTARDSLLASRPAYLSSQVYRYHDTFHRPAHVPAWPQVLPDVEDDDIDVWMERGRAIIGDPAQALDQCTRWAATGLDQLVLSIGGATFEDSLRTIELMGRHVIPLLDRDPIHRTTRFRESAMVATAG